MSRVDEIIAEFRANHGRVTSIPRLAHLQMVLVTNTGARSGTRYTTPLGVLAADDGSLVIAATAAASPTHPDWYFNLVANPRVTVEFGDDEYEADARLTEGEERQRRFDAMAEQIVIFKEYEQATPREIPVFVLERVE